MKTSINQKSRHYRSQRGFSLIEVIVALAIVAVVLAVIAVTIHQRSREQKVEQAVAEIVQIQAAAATWAFMRPGGFVGISCNVLAAAGKLAFLPAGTTTCMFVDPWRGSISVTGRTSTIVDVELGGINDRFACHQIASEFRKQITARPSRCNGARTVEVVFR